MFRRVGVLVGPVRERLPPLLQGDGWCPDSPPTPRCGNLASAMTKAELQHDPLPGATEKQVLRRRHGRVTETRDMVAAEVPVAFACKGEPFAVMKATTADLEDVEFGFALAQGTATTQTAVGTVRHTTHVKGRG